MLGGKRSQKSPAGDFFDKLKAAPSGGFTVSSPLAKIRAAHYNYNSVSVFVRSAGTAMFPAEICEGISEWSKEDKT